MKRLFNPFEYLSTKIGAPMGRTPGPDKILSHTGDVLRIAAKHQGGSEGYDRGGAYWGLPSDVWGVWVHGKGPQTVKYVRANTREGAIAKGMQL